MGYAEFHLSSDQKSSLSTISEPIFELTESIQPQYFNVKSVSLPLTFCTMRRYGLIKLKVAQAVLPNVSMQTHDFEFPACEVNYTLSTFAAELQRRIRALPSANQPPGLLGLDYKQITVNVVGGRLQFLVGNTFSGSNKIITLTWSGFIAEIANELDGSTLVLAHDTTVGTSSTLSKYPWQIVPTYVYLHSNIMGNTTYGRQLRVEGGYKMGSVLAKIPIDFELVYGDQVQDWTNPSIDKSFMFSNNSEFNHLMFWFTDSKGFVLDFQGVPFSLTLAMIL